MVDQLLRANDAKELIAMGGKISNDTPFDRRISVKPCESAERQIKLSRLSWRLAVVA